MKIAILGSSGFIGSFLSNYLAQKGFTIISLGRKDLVSLKELKQKLEGVDILINLAGAPISKKWDKEYKKILYSSRIDTTRTLFKTVKELEDRPKGYFSASAIGIYAPLEDKIQDEQNFVYGDNYLSKICIDWEQEAFRFENLGLRVVVFRFGVVLGKGGALAKMLPIFKLGLGGRIASGKQGFPWVHIQDLASAFEWALRNDKAKGVYNLCAPQITSNKDFTKALARVLKRPAFLPVPAFILKLLLGEGEIVLTKGPKVVPSRLQKEGFSFKFARLEQSLQDILGDNHENTDVA